MVYFTLAAGIVIVLGILFVLGEMAAKSVIWFQENKSGKAVIALKQVLGALALILIAFSPLLWHHILFDLQWFPAGFVSTVQSGYIWHPPGLITAALLDIILAVLAAECLL
jgi:hypothetical protein